MISIIVFVSLVRRSAREPGRAHLSGAIPNDHSI